ncbi:MerR family transcriptional regulator [Pedobacter sp. Leaf176]|uniref:MerR family transcriptional regulator n=1 Tax=Pedobacter sp. Leaf176 TaxID=1736286 RepID=UPI000700B9B2|nr:MerR family transcriptional regulator [Pedobacter sp. Leaf176]KQR67715.1 MerR family transcriptional regulator [Pedobacter sp. Leaf176]
MFYSIAKLEQLSGIHSHTIRMWEQRYNALKPVRTEGNTRLYDDDDLKKLLNIVSLNQSGLKISKICSLSESEFELLLDKQLAVDAVFSKFDYYITQLVKFGISYNEYNFDKLLTSCINRFGISECYRNVIYPLLVRLGLMWRKDDICPAQEHFLTNILRRKIFASIDKLPLIKKGKETWLLFLPEDEDHDVGLLFAHYLLRANNRDVIFLGSKVPLKSIERALQENKIDNVLLFLINLRPKKATQKYIDDLQKACSTLKVNLAGNRYLIEQLSLPSNFNCFYSLEEFEQIIQNPITS